MSPHPLSPEQWPWFWTFVLLLEERWERCQGLSILSDDEEPPPKEYWHDSRRVEAWVEEKRQERRDKSNAGTM